MPIKRFEMTTARAAIIGTLHKGGPKQKIQKEKDGKTFEVTIPGKDLDGYRFVTEDAEAAKAFFDAYGKEPKLVNILLVGETVDDCFEYWQEEYTASAFIHRCNGETMVRWRMQNGDVSDEPKPCPYKDLTREQRRKRIEARESICKAVGRMSVLIPELGRLVLVSINTTSEHDVEELLANLRQIYAWKGTLRGVPMILTRKTKNISTPATGGKRARRPKSLMHIEAIRTYSVAQIAEMQRLALPGQIQEMPPNFVEVDDEDEPLDAEFQPEPPRAASPEPAKPDSAVHPQIDAIRKLAARKGVDPNTIAAEAFGGKKLDELTDDERGKLIIQLQNGNGKSESKAEDQKADLKPEGAKPEESAAKQADKPKSDKKSSKKTIGAETIEAIKTLRSELEALGIFKMRGFSDFLEAETKKTGIVSLTEGEGEPLITKLRSLKADAENAIPASAGV